MDSTLMKGLRVLETLARSHEPRGVSELARQLDLTRSNVHRTLQTLTAAGYARQGSTPGTYECTLKLFELSSAVMDRVDVTRVAAPHMRRLAEVTEETVHLSTLSGAEVVYLDKIESPQPVRAYSSIGGRAPAHCVASGKALLAELSESNVDALFGDEVPASTGRGVRDRTELAAELASIRERGYAVNHGEWRESVGGVAAVIVNAAGAVEASIGVSGPLERVEPNSGGSYRDAVVEAARAISLDLGCTAYPPRRESRT
ncbi:IclR family transcriptional regulator [Prauserella cavernicola]|uniref:IclR family transcriptional regulator n=1 Tax=Prauserella cavernicola TaxID=2800127 RepID=A0A934QYE0_9PSEU|nr:IclR family transcriptional regulator [Prauserella cavernicola]MBK1787804.1 IclR family transcriptional regulator [Prauserella cavernicola]